MEEREIAIRAYFDAWLCGDGRVLGGLFEEHADYSESYGPMYHGLAEIERWFLEWNARGKVLRWDIRGFLHDGARTVVEWYFENSYDGEWDAFDGVSLVTWGPEGKILSLQEFASRLPHYDPFAPEYDPNT